MSPPKNQAQAALLAGIGCYTFWGLVPLVFQVMHALGASPIEIVANRTFWSVFWAGGFLLLAGQLDQVKALLRAPGVLALLFLSASLVSTNWGLYVWAVTNGHTLETSLGYYIIPLINMAAGAVLFREKLDRFALVAIAFAVVGVALQTWAAGRLPLISIILAATFGGYGIVRKRVRADALAGLFFECLFMTGPGLAVMIWLQATGQAHFFSSAPTGVALFLAGPLTVIPLALFSWAARRMPLSSMGFLQFLGPTIAFVIGVVEKEPFGPLQALSFVFIWAGAAVYGYGVVRAGRRAAAAVAAPEPEIVEAAACAAE